MIMDMACKSDLITKLENNVRSSMKKNKEAENIVRCFKAKRKDKKEVLKRTTVQRDEIDDSICSHLKTDEKLADGDHQPLQVADHSTQDVAKQHAKLVMNEKFRDPDAFEFPELDGNILDLGNSTTARLEKTPSELATKKPPGKKKKVKVMTKSCRSNSAADNTSQGTIAPSTGRRSKRYKDPAKQLDPNDELAPELKQLYEEKVAELQIHELMKQQFRHGEVNKNSAVSMQRLMESTMDRIVDKCQKVASSGIITNSVVDTAISTDPELDALVNWFSEVNVGENTTKFSGSVTGVQAQLLERTYTLQSKRDRSGF